MMAAPPTATKTVAATDNNTAAAPALTLDRYVQCASCMYCVSPASQDRPTAAGIGGFDRCDAIRLIITHVYGSDAFQRRKTVAALRLPAKLCSQAMKQLSDQVINRSVD